MHAFIAAKSLGHNQRYIFILDNDGQFPKIPYSIFRRVGEWMAILSRDKQTPPCIKSNVINILRNLNRNITPCREEQPRKAY